MKKLSFIFLGIIVVFINNIFSIVHYNLSNYQNNIGKLHATKHRYLFYYNKEHVERTVYHSYSRDNDYYYWIQTFPLGKILPLNFDTIKVIGKKYCYTKTSWGNTPYYGKSLAVEIDDRKFLDVATNSKVTTMIPKVFVRFATIKLLDILEYYMAAFIISKQFLGFTWYYDNKNHQFYLQVIIYYYTRVWGSSSNGGRWIGLGEGFEIMSNE